MNSLKDAEYEGTARNAITIHLRRHTVQDKCQLTHSSQQVATFALDNSAVPVHRAVDTNAEIPFQIHRIPMVGTIRYETM